MQVLEWYAGLPRTWRYAMGIMLLCLVTFYFCLPEPLFKEPVCMVLEAKDGSLLGARIASDFQWRFPHSDSVPEKFKQAIVTYEDKRFFSHFGFDPLAYARAIRQNIVSGEVVSGGSTISMQVIRLSRKGKSRTILEKIIELFKSIRLELRYSKNQILAFYASNAPFGGNTVGLDAASWRYFGKEPELLSWGEAATLAVLPNSPALIHPGRNRELLENKRNRLLKKLLERNIIDNTTYQLSVEEPIPDHPKPLPRLASHLLDRAFIDHFNAKSTRNWRIRTTINAEIQSRVRNTGLRYANLLKNNEINNLAILVLDVPSGEVIAYLGNAPATGVSNGEEVDIVKAPRSTGSILKPILYALMLQEGSVLPNSLVPDIPTNLNGFRPENYLETYDGVVKINEALSRSLNVPFVRLLQNYGLEKFHYYLKKFGISTITKPPSHYGLTLILGGAECTLWDITNLYACMARSLSHHYLYNGKFDDNDWRAPHYIHSELKTDSKPILKNQTNFLTTDAIWFTFEAMNEVVRPSTEGDWERFHSSRRIAWKTGTSFGNRDAWAIGVTPKFAVGVWVGNGDGEGRPGLVGVQAAAPILFDLFELLPPGPWFEKPYDSMKSVSVCLESGYLAHEFCPADTVLGPANSLTSKSCPYHHIIHMDASRKWRVNASCYLPSEMAAISWFILPPFEEHYYKAKNPTYKSPPQFMSNCAIHASRQDLPMQLIYPKDPVKIYVPIDLNGKASRTVFKVTHRSENAILYWHLDNEYIGSTKTFHNMEFSPSAGKHKLSVTDELGNILEQEFEILAKIE